METILQDIRHGARSLISKPGFTIVAILTLALGIGVNTAIFSVVDGVLLRPLPFKDPDRLVAAWRTQAQRIDEQSGLSGDLFIEWKDLNQTFEQMASYCQWGFNVSGGDAPEQIGGMRVSAQFLSTLGVEPMLGRAFSADEDQRGKSDVVVISHSLWQRRFGASPDIIGQHITIDDRDKEIIGVMPQSFRFFYDGIEIWVPESFDLAQLKNQEQRESFYLVVARLRPGITIEQARAQLASEAEQLTPLDVEHRQGLGFGIISLKENVVGEFQTAFLILLGAVGLVLLIACANVANLMLARAISRSKEISIRAALGASRLRLARQFLTESLMLSIVGGIIGILVAWWGVDSIIKLIPDGVPRVSDISIDSRVLLFMLSISLLAGLVFGLVPAIQASRPDLNAALKESGRSNTADPAKHFLRNLLVVSEITLSIVLLVGAGLLIRSFIQLQAVDAGFNKDNLLTVPVGLSPKKYTNAQEMNQFAEQTIEKIEALPGIESAGSTMFLPLGGSNADSSFTLEGSPVAVPGEEAKSRINIVSEGYFHTMGIPILSGREFARTDTKQTPQVAIINETLARRYWPNSDATGKRIKFGSLDNDSPWMLVVGVVKGVRHTKLQREPEAEVYIAQSQSQVFFPTVTFVVRTSIKPETTVASVRDVIWSVDRDQPAYDIKTMNQRFWDSIAEQRAQLLLLGLFAAMAIVLAAVGIYGVISYSVSERTHEIGVRMALGAQTTDVLKMILKQALLLALIGTAIGLTASFALTRLMSSMLYGVSATDAMTFAGVPIILTIVALVASYIPARRAMRVDPIVALRYE
jgi:putative ABC transport system permease protein